MTTFEFSIHLTIWVCFLVGTTLSIILKCYNAEPVSLDNAVALVLISVYAVILWGAYLYYGVTDVKG